MFLIPIKTKTKTRNNEEVNKSKGPLAKNSETLIIVVIIFLTDGTVFPCVSGGTITMEIIHFICTIFTILAWLSSAVINV